MARLRFGGSIWCNVDVAFRSVNNLYKQELESLELTVIECYVLQSLYGQDGQMASQLATSVQRVATSFTPVLDTLEAKGLIERQSNPSDRRSVKIYLTDKAKDLEYEVQKVSERVESKICQQFTDKEWKAFGSAVAALQTLDR